MAVGRTASVKCRLVVVRKSDTLSNMHFSCVVFVEGAPLHANAVHTAAEGSVKVTNCRQAA